jgi:dihydrofolate reductase
MSQIVVINHLTLDGVMQAPGRPDEDTRGSFEHGGWANAGNDEVMGRVMGERMTGGPLLLGRRTYEDFHSFWPEQTDSPFSAALNNVSKHVASTTLSEPLEWSNSRLLGGDVAAAVRELKAQSAADITILGSGELIRSLMPHDLIDEWVLMIHPLVLGAGQRMFGEGPALGALRLLDAVTTTTGVLIGTYAPARRLTDSR